MDGVAPLMSRIEILIPDIWSHVGRAPQHSAESCTGFSPGSSVSSHKESLQGGLGLTVRKIMRKTINIDS